MPSRLIREGILSSERVDELDAAAEVFYRRLMSKVDDHGLYDARLSILRTSLYPLRVDRVREADISRWIAACEKAGLIALYEHAGKPYLVMLDTRWTTRSEPKYPVPPNLAQMKTVENNCKQLKSTVLLDVVEDVVVVCAEKRNKSKTAIPENFTISESVRKWAAEKGHLFLEIHLENFINSCKAKGYTYADWDAAFRNAISKNWAKVEQSAGSSGTLDGVL